MQEKRRVFFRILVALVVTAGFLASCATNPVPSRFESRNVTVYTAQEVGLEVMYSFHDNPDSNNSFQFQLAEAADGALRITGTADFGEGFRTSAPLPLEPGKAFFFTVNVESGVAAPAGSEHTGFVDFFISADPDNPMAETGALLLRYEYWADADLVIFSTITFDGANFTLRTVDFQNEEVNLEGKPLTFVIYYDRAATAWVYRVEGPVEFGGQFDYGVTAQAFANGAYLAITGDRIARSPDSIVLYEVGTIE